VGIITALFVLSFLVFFHELGHFTAARFFGVQVDVFSIGFGKKLLTKKIGKTVWSFSLIPLGGYVKMKGQDDSDPTILNHDDDSYTTKKPWQRIVILLAGPFANFLLAFLLYLGIATMGVPTLLPTIGEVNSTQPAYKAGFLVGDQITQINGTPIHYWNEIGDAIKNSSPTLKITVLRVNTPIELTVTAETHTMLNMFKEKIERKIIGIKPDVNSTINVHYGPIESMNYAYEQTKASSLLILKSLQKLIAGAVPIDQLGGVVSIVDVTAKASHVGFIALLFFTALISVNLGVLNLLPIPALDGGHILFNLYEMITKKTPNEEIMYRLTLLGWGILLSMMIIGVYNDINRIIIRMLG